MKLKAFALDYDGTIATDGRLSAAVDEAIGRVRARGIQVLLVTGRRLDELRAVAGNLTRFDGVVAENGAVLSFPESGRSMTLAAPPSNRLVDDLKRKGIAARTGLSVIEVEAAHAQEVLASIRALELPLVLLFNRGRLMVLPQAVSKATGLREALQTIRLSAHNVVAVGDAENDHELLQACELGLAVEWGSQALREAADGVVPGRGPDDVAPQLLSLVEQSTIPLPKIVRRRLLLGHRDDGEAVSLAVRARNLLIAGDPRSGKSWVTGLMCEQLILARYSVCVIDPEGDYRGLEVLPGVTVLGADANPPTPAELTRALKFPDLSAVIDLSHLAHVEKTAYLRTLLESLTMLRRRTGFPHRIVVDEAHYFLHDPAGLLPVDLETGSYTLVTYRAAHLAPGLLGQIQAIVVTRGTDPAEAQALASRCGVAEAEFDAFAEALATLDLDEAVLLPLGADGPRRLVRFTIAPRLTRHVRHRAKYLDMPVSERQAFRFGSGRDGHTARSLREFAEIVAASRTVAIDRHLRHHDFSTWIGDVFGDHLLAFEIRGLEDGYTHGGLADPSGAIVGALLRRYDLRAEEKE
jgi:hypothetical protein